MLRTSTNLKMIKNEILRSTAIDKSARVLPATGDGGPNHPSVFSADRVDLLNAHKLLLL